MCLRIGNPNERAIARGRRAEARLREGLALCPAPLSAIEIDALIALGWLQKSAESDRQRVGEAPAPIVRDLAARLRA